MKLKEVWEAARRRWSGDAVPAIPRLCLTATAKASGTRQVRATTGAHTDVTQRTGCQRPPVHDPFRNLREQREKKRQSTFEYDPFTIAKTSSIERSIVKNQTQASARTAEQQTAERWRGLRKSGRSSILPARQTKAS